MNELVRVLIVEDDPMVAGINRKYTEKAGRFQVIGLAASGEEAVAAVREKRPDLVLLDVYLPRGNGLEVLKGIRAANIAADVILITAAQDVATVEEALRYGAVDYIIKPFDFERLARTLSAYCERRRRLAEHQKLAQEEIDRLVQGAAVTAAPTGLPKGIDPYTLEQVRDYLAQNARGYSAQETAAGLGLSRITARRYLEFLAAAGEVEVELEYAAVGRPVKRYRKA